ncbi:UbiA family prenyltransferase [Halorientalis regularis]|jgi:1,4-dihydroxy-2-naphthoate octaprenyltransferase|uniref:4-hydroxybenzoate polyprenyltransferase n=1 Tax=Halorientalis regularis TaxID=660518 RepID=A0A1G7PD78_9EURY|nr:UbiA family prenyltransferase [Halorientalis regularis]SDF83430.1 4-hydroxybenzoate polyprenyltransferase [Halorientalis regularis]
MAITRHGSGLTAAVGALSSQIHPVFMLPPLAASLFGALLAGVESLPLAGLHATAVFAGLYTAHVKDGYVDFFVRGEDDDHPLTARGCRLALAGATLTFACCVVAIALLVDLPAALLTAPGWAIGYFHAPQLDTHPVTATVGYPTGIAIALLGGYYVQAGTLAPVAPAFAGTFLVVLSGIKVIDDAQDYEYDQSIGKRTVAVVLGRDRARLTAYGLMGLGLAAVLAFAAAGVFPPSAAAAPAVFGAVALTTRRADDRLATMLLIRGSYLFLAVLIAATWFRPLAV